MFYPFSIKVNKCRGNCNNINDPYVKLCVPDIIKNVNVKVFNLMSWSNQTRHIGWHESCKCKCRLDASVCSNKTCGCECDRSCDIGEYLDHKNCKCKHKIAGALVEKCSKNIDKNEMICNGNLNTISLNAITLNDYKTLHSSCTLHIVLFAVLLVTSTVIITVFIYFSWYSKKNITNAYY